MSAPSWPEWEHVLSAAAHLQDVLPDATLVGGTAAAIFARHRVSHDADHVLTDLRGRFDDVLTQLESVAGWRTSRVKRPVMTLGSLDGIETGIRQLIRDEPLETCEVQVGDVRLVVPTEAELLRIKAVLILRRNATRDYLDFVALADLDRLYPQPNGESALQQLQVQLVRPIPYDLEQTNLSEYRRLDPKWQDWTRVSQTCAIVAAEIFRRL